MSRNARANVEALKMMNPTTQTMPIQGPYISDEELDRCGKAVACAHAVRPQIKDPALVDRQFPKVVHLEAKELEQGQGIEPGIGLADPGKTGEHATEAK
ncbi:hypothetical protein QFC19_007443 [Naganishia cerealis]|uniref:Uncharacterized protein n=2 Tax=Naganishia cerealis TaxID=610337 RepID=A0ACC2V8X4_9TREE|nr:hypothetical protein QFC19_007669 [Naganishia cerealis]KAJ9095828.1 hypothetical protein QFC19_007443 [Naganishia cerealis]